MTCDGVSRTPFYLTYMCAHACIRTCMCLCVRAGVGSSYGDEHRKGRVCVVTSGKGGVGKTTITASLAYTLATYGYKTVAVDFDIGLRNLDLHFGCERRVIYDLVNVMHQECGLGQALIKYRFDKKKHPDQIAKTTDGLKDPELYILAASQTRDKEVLTIESVERVINQLKKRFDYIVLDSPGKWECVSTAQPIAYARSHACAHTRNGIGVCGLVVCVRWHLRVPWVALSLRSQLGLNLGPSTPCILQTTPLSPRTRRFLAARTRTR